MTRAAVEQLLYLMDEAFDASGHDHSMLANLSSLRDEDWDWQPPGGRRTIFEIAYHVGVCKYVYDNHAFGDGCGGTVRSACPESALRPQLMRWSPG